MTVLQIVSGFRGEIEKFAGVLERFDEIILQKANKADVINITHQLESYMLTEEFV